MKLSKYKKLKAVLDTAIEQETHHYEFIGSRTVFEGTAMYAINLVSTEKQKGLEAIYGIDWLFSKMIDAFNGKTYMLPSAYVHIKEDFVTNNHTLEIRIS